jgi:putative NADH-flavin reductase
MKLLVIGATGRTGRLVVERALEAGHEVTAFARDPSKVELSHERLEVTNGDALNEDDLIAALRGQEAVISAIGGSQRRLMEYSARVLVAAMRRTGVRRVVWMSTFIATPNYRPLWLARKLFSRLLRGLATDDRAGNELIAGSRLDWTIVHATLLENKPASGYRLVEPGESVTSKSKVSRADVADCLVAALADPGTIGQSLLVTGR